MNAVRNSESPSQELLRSRAELRQIMDEFEGNRKSANFPRSKTFRMLMSRPGVAILGVAAAGVLITRPNLVARLIRTVPVATMLRTLALRFVSR